MSFLNVGKTSLSTIKLLAGFEHLPQVLANAFKDKLRDDVFEKVLEHAGVPEQGAKLGTIVSKVITPELLKFVDLHQHQLRNKVVPFIGKKISEVAADELIDSIASVSGVELSMFILMVLGPEIKAASQFMREFGKTPRVTKPQHTAFYLSALIAEKNTITVTPPPSLSAQTALGATSAVQDVPFRTVAGGVIASPHGSKEVSGVVVTASGPVGAIAGTGATVNAFVYDARGSRAPRVRARTANGRSAGEA